MNEPTQRTYRVVYEIDIVANSTKEAAREAFACMQAEPILDIIPWIDEDTPPTFTCDSPNCTSIDLEQI